MEVRFLTSEQHCPYPGAFMLIRIVPLVSKTNWLAVPSKYSETGRELPARSSGPAAQVTGAMGSWARMPGGALSVWPKAWLPLQQDTSCPVLQGLVARDAVTSKAPGHKEDGAASRGVAWPKREGWHLSLDLDQLLANTELPEVLQLQPVPLSCLKG